MTAAEHDGTRFGHEDARAVRPAICVVGELPPPPGGMGVQAERLSQGLRREGHEVVNVPTNALAFSSRWRRIRGVRGLVNWVLFLSRLRRATAADCLHILSHSYLSFFLFTAPAVVFGRAQRKPVVVHYHGGAAEAFLNRWSHLAIPFLRMAEHVVVPSGFLEKVFRRHGIETREIPNILDLAAYRYRERRAIQPRILMARHLEPAYNVACGIRAFARVAERFPEARLTIAGDGSERAQLVRLCRELGIADRIEFLGDVEHARMADLYNEADIFLNSSRIDNQPVSILEAFASGVPVVTTAVGGIPHMVAADEHGLLAAADDDDGLARHMLALLNDPALTVRLSRNGHRQALRHEWASIYPLLAPLYRS